jgi:ferredoxin-NADP reductase
VDYSSPQFVELCKGIVDRMHPRRMHLRVVDVTRETRTAKTFRFERLDGEVPPHRPGQFMTLYVRIGTVRTSRPYSIVSVPCADTIDITVRAKSAGFVSSWLCSSVSVGDEFESTGPIGEFYYEPLVHGDDLVFIAGGSGITPFMSMLREKQQAGDDRRRVHLIYGTSDAADVIFETELNELARTMPDFTWDLVVSAPPKGWRGLRGFIDAPLIEKRVEDVESKTFFVCGPSGLQKTARIALEDLGVPRRRLVTEAYGPPGDITAEPGWPDGLHGEDVFSVKVEGIKRIEALAGEPLMNSLERNGILIPARCRSGRCAACNTKVLEGKVFTPPLSLFRESSWIDSFVHACVSYPVGPLTIRISAIR